MISPDVVAAKALKDADRGKDMSVYSLYVKSCHMATRIFSQRFMMKLWMMQQREKRKTKSCVGKHE